MNRMQREVCAIDAHTNVVVAGRGTGKSMLHAWINLRNMQAMPRSTTAFVCPTAIRAKTNTLPSMFEHWEKWGYRRGLHWDIGHRPPRALDWPAPLVTPDNWENIITFYNGAIGQIVSQDRVGTSNSKSFDYIDIDEAKFVDYERLKDETFPANRGQQREFGDLPFHHGMLITSDMPISKRGSWFMRYADQCDAELISTIEALVSDEQQTMQRIAQGDTPTCPSASSKHAACSPRSAAAPHSTAPTPALPTSKCWARHGCDRCAATSPPWCSAPPYCAAPSRC